MKTFKLIRIGHAIQEVPLEQYIGKPVRTLLHLFSIEPTVDAMRKHIPTINGEKVPWTEEITKDTTQILISTPPRGFGPLGCIKPVEYCSPMELADLIYRAATGLRGVQQNNATTYYGTPVDKDFEQYCIDVLSDALAEYQNALVTSEN